MSTADIFILYKLIISEIVVIKDEIENIRRIPDIYNYRLGNVFCNKIENINNDFFVIKELIEYAYNNIKNIEIKIVCTKSQTTYNYFKKLIMKRLPEIWITILITKTMLDNMLIYRNYIILPIFVSTIINTSTNIRRPLAQRCEKVNIVF